MASPNKTSDNLLILPPKPAPVPVKSCWDIGHPGWSLVLWTIFLALPFAYVTTCLNTLILQAAGYEEFMRNPGGLLLNKCIFIFVNLGLILAWYAQLNAEAERVKCEKEREELKWWDEVLSVLRREREAGREFSKDLYQASFPGEQ